MHRDIEQLLAPCSADEVWHHFVEIVRRLGYPHVFYSIRRFADMSRLWQIEDLEWRSNFPAAFLDELRGTSLLAASPWGIWSRVERGVRAFDWIGTDEAAPYLTADGRRLTQMMDRHGVKTGHVISLLGVSARVSGTVALSTGPGTDQHGADELWQKSGPQIRVLSEVMHLRICALPQTVGRGVLTPRQRQVVEWAAYGKTVSEIAEILGVESTTVEKHLRLARESLGASTTGQAILQAHQRNQIFTQDRNDGGSW